MAPTASTYGNGKRLAVAGRVGIFERDHARDRVVDVVLTEGSLDLVEGKRPVRTLADGADGRPHEGGVASGLVDDDVRLSAGDRLHPAAEVRELRDEIALGATGDEDGGFLAEQVGGAFLERVDGGVVAEDVVAELRLRHRASHLRRRPRHGVAPKVDQGHGREYRTRTRHVPTDRGGGARWEARRSLGCD